MESLDEIQGLVEVADSLEPDRRREFVRRAYRASAELRLPVGLVLKGVDRREVDRVLDDLVEQHGPRGPRVYYLDYRATPDLLAMASRSRFVVAVSEEFKARLSGASIGFFEPSGTIAFPTALELGAA